MASLFFIHDFDQDLIFFLLVFVRVSSAVALLPALGEQVLSVRVKLVCSFLLTFAIYPAVAQTFVPNSNLEALEIIRIFSTELFVGFFIGISLRLFIFSIQTAGSIAAQSTSLAQLMGQSGIDPLPAIGHILTMAALALLVIFNLPTKFTGYFIVSYQLFPAMHTLEPSTVADGGRILVSRSFALAFTLAAPFLILSALYNVTLGVINRAMPQLMVAFVGAPLITWGAISLLLLSAPLMLAVWLEKVEQFLRAPFW